MRDAQATGLGKGGHREKNDNCIGLVSHLNSFRFAFWFPISPLILRLCHQHLHSRSVWKATLPLRGRGQAPFPEPGTHFALFVVCFSESLLGGTRACACVWRGGNNCAINDCYFDYRMQLSLRLEANQRVVSGSPLVLSNGPWLKRKLLAIFKQRERKQHGWRWGKCQTLTPDGSQLIFTVV